jgi:hypothetical protein
MAIKITKKDKESTSAFLYRVSQVIQKSGVLIEANKHQAPKKKNNERGKKLSALHKIRVKKEIEHKKKMGISLKKR